MDDRNEVMMMQLRRISLARRREDDLDHLSAKGGTLWLCYSFVFVQ